jgi:Tfp pilus assembly protein PilV
VSLVIVSVLILALAAGLLFVVRVTRSNADTQAVQVTAANFAERLKAAPYESCARPQDYLSSVSFEPPPGMAVAIESIAYWQRRTAVGAPGAWRSSCGGDDQGSQLLTVSVTAGERSHQLDVVKADR